MNRDISIVEHMILHAERIVSKTSNKTLDDFSNNPDDKDIVCFNFIQMGELAKSLSFDFCINYSSVDWRGLKGVRDKIAHGYGDINFSLIFSYSTNQVPSLLEVCKNALKDLKQN